MKKTQQSGFIGLLVVIILALVAAKYFFNFSIFDWAASPGGKSAVDYLWEVLTWLKNELVAVWGYIH